MRKASHPTSRPKRLDVKPETHKGYSAIIARPLLKNKGEGKMNILQDIATAVKLTGEVRKARKARKAGADGLQVRRVWSVPVIRCSYWGSTMEGCLFYEKKWKPLRDVFDSFPQETQHALTFTPKDGEWADRARFWQYQLRTAMEPKLYQEAMGILLRWYIHCVRMRREEVTA